MLTNDRERAICKRYSVRIDGKVRCNICPLRKGSRCVVEWQKMRIGRCA